MNIDIEQCANDFDTAENEPSKLCPVRMVQVRKSSLHFAAGSVREALQDELRENVHAALLTNTCH